MEAESDKVDEKPLIGNESLELQEIGTTPEMKGPLPEASQDTKEESGEAVLIIPTVSSGDRCETSMNSLLVDSPSRLRASPKRKQLSPPEGDEAGADREKAVKRHRGSISDRIPFPRLPGRMPYGLTPPPEEATVGAAGPGGDGLWSPRRKRDRWIPRQSPQEKTGCWDPLEEMDPRSPI